MPGDPGQTWTRQPSRRHPSGQCTWSCRPQRPRHALSPCRHGSLKPGVAAGHLCSRLQSRCDWRAQSTRQCTAHSRVRTPQLPLPNPRLVPWHHEPQKREDAHSMTGSTQVRCAQDPLPHKPQMCSTPAPFCLRTPWQRHHQRGSRPNSRGNCCVRCRSLRRCRWHPRASQCGRVRLRRGGRLEGTRQDTAPGQRAHCPQQLERRWSPSRSLQSRPEVQHRCDHPLRPRRCR
mmetsp:Transcript_25549/g.56327  ORF Transcript_25549/g.56327 Transcript_25549/m.56327 type:complete len:232 (+) Transcript_25549:315-1010(+)